MLSEVKKIFSNIFWNLSIIGPIVIRAGEIESHLKVNTFSFVYVIQQ